MKTSDTVLRKIYLSLYLKGFCVCERVLETEQNCNIFTPTPMAISVSFPFSWCCSTRGLGTHSAECWLSLPHLVKNGSDLQTSLQTNWLPVFTELYNSLIAHSISLELHVWSSSNGNNCHAVHRSGASFYDGTSFYDGASFYDGTMGLYLVPYFQPSPPTRWLSITAIGMCHFRRLWPGRRSTHVLRLFHLASKIEVFVYPFAYLLIGIKIKHL